MFARISWQGALLAVSFVSFVAAPLVLAENPLNPEPPAPSRMPQQPTLEQQFAHPRHQNQRVVPPGVGIDQPGIPSIAPPGQPGAVHPQTGAPLGKRSLAPQTGGIVFPEGIPSSVRIGPVYQAPLWQRSLLATWLLLQLVVLVVVAVAMQIFRLRIEEEQHGHTINPETTEAFNVHRHAPHTP